jgi:hypothetical protein
MEFMSPYLSEWREKFNVAMWKLVTKQQNLFPEIGRVLTKLAAPWGAKSEKVLSVILRLYVENVGRPPSYKEVCYRLFGANWTDSQQAFVRKVARQKNLHLMRLS